jgi:hypothetical protein
VVVVLGTSQVVVDGTATRAGMPAAVVAGGKLIPESAAPDFWASCMPKLGSFGDGRKKHNASIQVLDRLVR